MTDSYKLKVGDIIYLDTKKILETEICHKSIGRNEDEYLIMLCEENEIPRLSHDEWEFVNCKKCLALKN